jgi:FixJ family two-component response regulator
MPAIVHFVDDDAAFRAATTRLLRASGYEVAEYESATDFLKHVPLGADPCCIVLDVRLPGLNGLGLHARLTELGSTVPIVFLTGYGDIRTGVQSIKAGAEDFLTKPVSADTLIEAIGRAIARFLAMREEHERTSTLRSLIARLTPRERAVLDLVVQGQMNKQIAYALGTTERTIKAHRHQVMAKVGVRSLAELVSIAEHAGLISRATRTARPVRPAAAFLGPGCTQGQYKRAPE